MFYVNYITTQSQVEVYLCSPVSQMHLMGLYNLCSIIVSVRMTLKLELIRSGGTYRIKLVLL